MTLSPCYWMMAQHLEWLTDVSYPNLRFELAWGPPGQGPTFARTFTLDDIDLALSEAVRANSSLNNVYVGVTLKHFGTPAVGRTRNEHAVLASCLALDFDSNAIVGAKLAGQIARPQLLVITGRTPELRLQLWIRLHGSDDLSRWHNVSRRYAAFTGADAGALGVSRLMRLAGTVSYPGPAKQARGYVDGCTELIRCSFAGFDLGYLDQQVPHLQGCRSTATKAALLPLNATNVKIVASALSALPAYFAERYVEWRNIGFALHDFSPGPVGLELWKRFSRRCPEKAERTTFDALWARFGRERTGNDISLGTLLYHAKNAGWQPPTPWDRVTQVA